MRLVPARLRQRPRNEKDSKRPQPDEWWRKSSSARPWLSSARNCSDWRNQNKSHPRNLQILSSRFRLSECPRRVLSRRTLHAPSHSCSLQGWETCSNTPSPNVQNHPPVSILNDPRIRTGSPCFIRRDRDWYDRNTCATPIRHPLGPVLLDDTSTSGSLWLQTATTTVPAPFRCGQAKRTRHVFTADDSWLYDHRLWPGEHGWASPRGTKFSAYSLYMECGDEEKSTLHGGEGFVSRCLKWLVLRLLNVQFLNRLSRPIDEAFYHFPPWKSFSSRLQCPMRRPAA